MTRGGYEKLTGLGDNIICLIGLHPFWLIPFREWNLRRFGQTKFTIHQTCWRPRWQRKRHSKSSVLLSDLLYTIIRRQRLFLFYIFLCMNLSDNNHTYAFSLKCHYVNWVTSVSWPVVFMEFAQNRRQWLADVVQPRYVICVGIEE